MFDDHLSMSQYVLKWPLKHEIGNANMFFYQNNELMQGETKSKHLVISYKVRDINLYSVMIIELDKGSNKIILRNEIWHMWE
jgi:hypothetical protein